MFSVRSIVVLASIVTAAFANVVPINERSLPSGTVTCGSNGYSPSQLTAAINAGVKYLNANNLQGTFYFVAMNQRLMCD